MTNKTKAPGAANTRGRMNSITKRTSNRSTIQGHHPSCDCAQQGRPDHGGMCVLNPANHHCFTCSKLKLKATLVGLGLGKCRAGRSCLPYAFCYAWRKRSGL